MEAPTWPEYLDAAPGALRLAQRVDDPQAGPGPRRPPPSFTVGRSRRFSRGAVDAWMARRMRAALSVDAVLEDIRPRCRPQDAVQAPHLPVQPGGRATKSKPDARWSHLRSPRPSTTREKPQSRVFTPERRLFESLLDAFFDLSAPRRSRPRTVQPAPGLEHHEPIPKVEAAVVVKPEPADILHQEVVQVEPEDTPKVEHPAVTVREAKALPIDHDVDVEPDDLLVTNTNSGAQAVALVPVVNPIAATTVESALRSQHHVDVTNAARQSRWRSKQDVAALRLQARERMKVLRARRRAAP